MPTQLGTTARPSVSEERVDGVRRRRRWSAQEKLQIVLETLDGSLSVPVLAVTLSRGRSVAPRGVGAVGSDGVTQCIVTTGVCLSLDLLGRSGRRERRREVGRSDSGQADGAVLRWFAVGGMYVLCDGRGKCDMHLTKMIATVVIAMGVSTGWPAVADENLVPMSAWQLAATPSEDRWLELHQIEGVGENRLFHVSVLSREKGHPVWSLKHIVPHMAITEVALRRSITGPAPKQRTSYPDQYNAGYGQWLKLKAQGAAPICETSVLECARL